MWGFFQKAYFEFAFRYAAFFCGCSCGTEWGKLCETFFFLREKREKDEGITSQLKPQWR